MSDNWVETVRHCHSRPVAQRWLTTLAPMQSHSAFSERKRASGGAQKREEHVRTFVRDNVRAGLLDAPALRAEVERAVREELPWLPVTETVEAWLSAEQQAWYDDAATWADPTDHDRLIAAFDELESAGVAVLQACESHWVARDLLRSREDLHGVAWFLPSDVWHAIDEGMLEVNVWHASGANVAPGDALLELAVSAFARQGLAAHFDEGRIEVSAHWRRRPS